MPDPKRCEVCGLLPCNLWMTGCADRCHCKGHNFDPKPVPNDRCRVCYAYPHRGEAHHPECMFKPPSEWEKDFEEGGKFEHIHCSIKYDGEHECADHDCVTVALIPYIRSLLLSYGKEREKAAKMACGCEKCLLK